MSARTCIIGLGHAQGDVREGYKCAEGMANQTQSEMKPSPRVRAVWITHEAKLGSREGVATDSMGTGGI